jgi:chromosomal replication initiation ATPase DnaA
MNDAQQYYERNGRTNQEYFFDFKNFLLSKSKILQQCIRLLYYSKMIECICTWSSKNLKTQFSWSGVVHININKMEERIAFHEDESSWFLSDYVIMKMKL